jgi:hypothetical protein
MASLSQRSAPGNYFVWWEGKVYYSNHDGGDDDPFGDSLSEFLDRIAANPAQFLYDAGCYTCYTRRSGHLENTWPTCKLHDFLPLRWISAVD